MALRAVASGAADVVAFGKAFISNPDLVRRLRDDLPLAALNPKTLYGGGAAGYTDYPAYALGACRAFPATRSEPQLGQLRQFKRTPTA
jgi:2,4-dienoyl-CoA reductase-like NADH-dependent reductase (Old Yellow Enzyme family)